MAQNNFLQSPFDALATATEESIYSLPPLPGQKSSTPTQVSEVPRDTRAPAVEQPEEPVAGQPVKAKPGQYLPPANLRPVFEAAAREFNVPVNVLMALGHQESRFNPAAIGPSTQWGRAKGMMQYLDSTASGLGINPFDPNQAVPAAARQLRERLDKGYSMEDAVKEHFAGPNRKLWGEKTAAYGREVMQKVGFIGEELGAGAPPAAAADPLADMNKAEPGRYRVATPEEVAAFEKKQAAMTEAERVESAAQQKKNDDRGFGERASEALSSGTDNMVQSLNTSRFVMAGGDSQLLAKALADKFAAGQERAKQKTTGEREMDASFQAVTDAEGVVDTTLAGAKAIGTAVMNPKDLAVGVIEQLPNMLPTMGAGVAGAGGGAAIGGGAGALAAGVGAIPGAITGAIVGGRAGMVAGTTATELGAEVEYMIGKRLEEAKQPPTPENIKALLDDPLFIGEARKQGLAKGLTVGLIDQLFMGLAGKVAGKTTSATTKTRKVALGTGAVGLDATGEVVGETASQQVARGEVDAGDALKEGVYGLGQSIVEPAVGATMQAAGKTAKAMRPGEAPPRVEPGTAPTATPPAAPAAQTPAAPQAPATPSGPLTAAVERAAETPAEQPQRVSVVAPEGEVTGFMESMQQDGQGGFVARILGDDGQVYNFTSADQVTITPEAPKAGPLTSAVEAAAETQPGAPVTQPAPTGSTPVEGAGSSQPTQVAPDFADLFDEQGRPKFPNAQTVRDFKKRTGLGQDGVRAIQAAIQEGRQITLEEAMQADKDARAERAAALEQDKKDSEAEAEKAKANAASPAKKREVVGEFEIPGLEGATNRVRVFRQGSRVDAVGLDEGTANNDLTALIAYGMTVEQALAQFYGDHAQGATPDASKVNRVDGRQDQTASPVDVSEDGAGASQPPQAAPTLAEMDEPALRERLKYIASQGKANGWNKLLTNARREVEAEINKRTEGAKTDERADSAGVRVPDVSAGSVQADAPRGADQPAGREGDAQLRDGVQADPGPAVPADGNAVPAAGAAADRQPALTPKQSAALDRIAKGTAFFGTPEKADAFIAKNEIGDTHEVVQTGKVRFEVKAKAPATAKGSSSVQADATPAIIPAGGTTTADEREPEQSKKQSKVLPREMDEDGRAKDGKPINPGDVFKTLSGRETSPYPKQKSERYASEWLIENAASEAESRGDKFNSRTFRATKPNKSGGLTTADRESMLMYLFGYQPDVVPSILKPLVPSKPDTSLIPQSESQAVRDFLDGKRPDAPTLEEVANTPQDQVKLRKGDWVSYALNKDGDKAIGEVVSVSGDSLKVLTDDGARITMKRGDATYVSKASAAAVPVGGTVTKDEPPEENKPAAEQAPAPAEPLLSVPADNKPAEQAWSESSPADRRKMLADAGYTDGDQARVLSGTDWADLSDDVRGKIELPAVVDQEPIKNETPAQQGSETAEQASDQEKFSANRVKRAGGFFMDLKDVAKNGDDIQSPWLLSDGRIVGTGGDHISFAGQYLPGGAAGYSDFMKETGAVRASFFNDADRGYVATLHVAKGQNLTPEQLGALKFIESQRGAPMVVLFGAADGLVNPEFTETTVSALASDQETAPASGSLVDALYGQVSSGNMPSDNNALRKMVAEIDGAPADNTRLKAAQEALEAAMVRLARDIVAEGKSIRETYDKLVALYASQPNLNIRTSTSIENQAYSTPAPLAYLSAKLAGIDGKTKVYEPTAGNGMLLITADPKNATANELEDTRFANLKSLGFDAMQGDAMEAISSGAVVPGSQDAVITNPPFGSVKDDAGKATKVSVDGYKIGKIDHLIAAEALKAMKDDGKATLIIGADKVAGGIGTDDRIFFNWLYGNYDVTSHFEADGKLYARQGASWPVRVITINGRKKSAAVSPRPGDVKRVSTWEEVYEQYQQGLDAQINNDGSAAVSPDGAVQRDRADDAGASPVATGAQDRADGAAKPAARNRSDGNVAGERAGTVRTGAAGATERTAGDTGAQRRNEPAAVPDRLEEGSAKDRPASGKARADRPAGDAGADRVGNEFQSAYVPRSSRKDEGVLIPVNMAQPTQDALNALEDEVGDIDEYVMRELGYPSKKALHDALMGLQVDSVASAIYQISKGKGAVIADQTGIGKGRQAAAIIRWAKRKGHLPVFVTVKPQLFTDMFNDLADIGTDDVAPLLLNADEWIANAAGEKLFTNKKSAHRKVIADIAATGELPQGRNALFLTYSQINTENAQRSALSALAPRAVFILDESHNAGGASQTGEFVRTILGEAVGVTYLSATYAKRPDNMPVYFKTDIGMAISDDGQLTGAMAAGGLPLQTVVSHNLVKAGQMFRRERSYDGVSITTTADTARREEHEKLSDTVTLALRGIVEADRAFHNGFVEQMAQQLAKEGAALKDIAGNQASQSVNHTEFSSVVHNFVRQMLLGLKADSAADKAIEALKAGQKPLIAVENTMGSFLAEYAANSNIRQGQPLGRFDYRTVLERALERSRVIVIKDATGNDTKRKVELSELDPVTRDAYDRAQAIIRSLDLDIPVSPIDWMRNRIEQAGYSVAEITGRNLTVDYSEGAPKLSQLPTEEQNDKVGTTRKFNDGRLDALILNVSGSTGISLHASEKFKDQRPRHMIVAQAAQDINIFMQMLGRIHRTGQVKLPSYEILSVDLPAEKRPTSILSNKMKSLNANTSSNTESATSIKSSDLLNKYGDQVVGAYLADNDELAQALGIQDPMDSEGHVQEDLARKATGRLALMPVEVQKAFYAEVEEQYSNLIDYLNKTNQNELEPRTFDYDAKETAAQVVFEGDNPSSPFGADAIYHEYSIKAQGKPMTPDEIRAEITESLGGQDARQHAADIVAGLDAQFAGFTARLTTDGQMSAANIAKRKAGEFIRDHRIGSGWRVEINGDVYNAVVTNIRSTHKGAGNPFSMSKIQVTVALNGALRSVTVPATQFEGIEVAGLGAAPRIDGMFEQTPQDERQTAKIITGNLLAAYGEISTKGTIINFTKADGTTEQGILLPKVFNPAINTRGDYRMRSVADALKFLRESEDANIARFGVSNREGTVRVVPDGAGVALVVPKSKAKGGKFFLNKKLTDITGDFVSQGQTMRVEIPASKAADAVAVVMDMNALYALPSMAVEAKKIVGDGSGETRYSVAGSAGFFSALAQFVENAEAKSATADGWMQQIRGQVSKGNVKADEVAWTGVEEWLGTQTGKVPREAVSEFLRANGVQVTETVLGEPDYSEVALWWNDEGGANEELPFDELTAQGKAEAAERYADEVGQYEEGTRQTTKYSNYTLPGGENYREVLLTLPDSPKADSRLRAISDEIGDPNTSEARVGELRAERDRLESDLEKTPVYRSSHWDQSNILAHIRLNDRTDADGKRVLFVEEIQSDWGQDGKKKGFANPNSPVYAVFAKSGAFLKSFEDKADADAFAETVSGDVRAEKRQPGDDSRPPSAPFIDKTDKWVALALKRVIKMAVDEGYDRVAFVTGEQSAARYDLSKHIDRIHYEKSEDGLYELIAYKIGSRDDSTGSEALHEDEIDLARIEELVGKDIAQKIADEAGDKIGGSYRDWRELKNVDLKVGGEGMKAFYDRIVPSVLKDVLKKVGGGTVGVVELQIPGAQPGSRDVATGAVVGPNGTAGQNLDAPGFDITPAMKKKAANGLPLFSAGVGGTLTKPALRDRLTTGVIGPVVSRLIDAGVIVMHKDVSTLPKSIKAVRGMQAATDGKTVHMVASGLTADTARGALFHEFFHTGGENLIGTEQWGKLMGRLSSLQKQGQQSNGKAREFFDKARARVQAAEQRGAVTEGFAPEEFGAYAIEEYENAPATVRKWVDDLIGAVKAWALKRFGKQLGDVTPAQLSAIAKMALMDAAAERMTGRPTMMSARGLTDAPAFKRWFNGSKVVDANGDPLVVYHGTNADFSEFATERRSSKTGNPNAQLGYFFTDSAKEASRYASGWGKANGNVMPVYLALKNPYQMPYKEFDGMAMAAFRSLQSDPEYDPNAVVKFGDMEGQKRAAERLSKHEDAAKAQALARRAELIAEGYDGVMAKVGGVVEYVVFDSTQIKSAIGNNGAFDPANPDIRYSSRSKTDTPAFRRWFGSSEAVNADGSPMVLYHGTGADIAVFDPKRTTSIDGIFTTPKAGYASQVAAGTGGAPNVMPLYASIQNAARMKAADYTAANVRKAMADRAVDGVIVTDAEGNVDTVIVKRPDQLKSVFNAGGFNPGNPDVRYSVSPPVFDWSNPGGKGVGGHHFRDTKVGDTTIGYGIGRDGTAEIISVRTPQAKRGNGSARRALEAFLREADERGFLVGLWSSPLDKKTDGRRLFGFYKSLGFEPTGKKINAVGDPEMMRAARPASSVVRYSVSPEEAERVIDDADKALDAAPDRLPKDDYIGRVVGDMSLGARLLVHPRTVASVHPEFTPVYMTAISQIETRDANIADLGTGAAAYSKLDEAGKTSVNRALELGRLMSQTYTAEQLAAGVTNRGEKTVVSVGEDGKPRTTTVPVDALLSGAGEVVKLSPEEATAYTDLRAMFDRALDKMRDQTLEELGFPELAGLKNAAREIAKLAQEEMGDKAERLKNIAVFVAEIEQAKRAGYVPFARYGDYVVTVKEKIADLTYVEDDAKHLIVQDVPAAFAGDLLDMGAEETPEGWRIKKSQKADVERLTEKTVYSTKVETGLRDFFDERKAGKVDDIGPVRDAIEKARAEYVGDNPSRRVVAFKAREKTPDAPVVLSDVDALAEVAQIDNATWDAVRDKLADAIKAKGFRRHFFHSDNVPGYTGDFERAIADYVIGMSGYLARRAHMKQWDNSVTAIKDKPKLFQYASKYRDYVNSPQEEFAMVRQVGFFAYIAGVVASAFANLTQVPMLTLPTLSQIAPVPLVMKEVARAYKDTFKMLGRPGKVGLDMFDPDKAPADVRDALKEAWVEGSFVPLETYDLMMTARQRNVGARKGVKLFNDTTKVVALFFTFAERVNRLVTFIAAARLSEKPAVRANANRVLRNDALARREVLANWGQKSLAEWAVDETQYRMGKANRPTMMRGVGSAIMQFKGYMLQTFEAWYRMSKLHGKEGKFAMAASLVTLYALSGLWGMPGADDLRKLIENIYRQIAKKDLDLKTELRQWIAKMSGSNTLAQIVNKGVTYPAGVDLARVGMGSVVPDSPLAAAGIPFDLLVGRPLRAFEKGSSGDLYGAVAELTPNFMKHWIVAGGWAVDGVRDKQGSRILRPEDLSDSDIGMKALGFQPSIITDVRDYEYAQRRQETAVDALKRRYTNQLAKALAAMETESDPKELAKLEERVAEVYADLDAHNETASEEQQIVIGKRALDNRIQREAEGIKSTWGKERKNARGAAEDLRGVFGLSEEDE